jgi:polyisoprenoid-binding protein YceI
MRQLLAACALVGLAACSQPGPEKSEGPPAAAAAVTSVATELPAGSYTLDKSHASLVFRVDHLGFSKYTGRFTDYDARLQLDPANPAAAALTVTIDPRSLSIDNPPAGFLDALRGPDWLDAARYPEMAFRSTSVQLTGANTARVVGDFTLHGVTRPVTLEAKFNGGYAGHPMDPNARIGFSARGSLKRSEFGIAYGIPAPGTTMGVGDDVEIVIETEFSGPKWSPPANAQ